ncbi:hypothetical protein UMC2_33911 [[Clostridium] sordellii]|uniref:hypothetical protein n=1 Tax=Paraclostridium sordellii TaxID=1505 RepID=UPI000543B4C9|nr:hypothetical protein [Paeniclostridium sordellii]CEK36521.1 hypothetical protein UMC2_33911 [[Clostridium] sordellii] [Paeniclostridium sordellii]
MNNIKGLMTRDMVEDILNKIKIAIKNKENEYVVMTLCNSISDRIEKGNCCDPFWNNLAIHLLNSVIITTCAKKDNLPNLLNHVEYKLNQILETQMKEGNIDEILKELSINKLSEKELQLSNINKINSTCIYYSSCIYSTIAQIRSMFDKYII